MNKTNSAPTQNTLPWWTWVLPLFIFHAGSQISILLKYDQGVTTYYLPTALAVILINWWGPQRVLPSLFINATLSNIFWGVERVYLWPIYAIPETIFAIISWYFFSKKLKGKYWLPDNQSLLYFLLLGITFPALVEILLLQAVQIYSGEQQLGDLFNHTSINLLSEFTSNFGLCLPVLYYVTPHLQKANLLYINNKMDRPEALHKNQYIEILALYFILTILVFTLNFENFWFIYGILPLYTAIRFGFGQAIIMNFILFLATYVIPQLFQTSSLYKIHITTEFVYLNVGTLLLYVFSAITGRVISDLRIVKRKLSVQNDELEQINKELDRFVYSVSHDLSAPLKSILGLVNISRLSNNESERSFYFNKVETSVLKLDSFIKEILDYSQNKRKEVSIEVIQLKKLCQELLDGLRYIEGYERLTIDLSDLNITSIQSDKSRLKIVLNNLIANAIKFQKKRPEHQPYIKITSQQMKNDLIIKIEDNGQGILPEVQDKIFNMFFRGTEGSPGSGLGLYIAKEAAEKINGKISVTSEYGKGSVFTLRFKNLVA